MNIAQLGTAVSLLITSVVAATACDWDSVDPRLGAGGSADGGSSAGGSGSVGGGGVGGGGGMGQGGELELDCGAVDIAIDDFEDGMRDPNKWIDYADLGGSTQEMGGQLMMTVGASSSSDAFWETRGFMNLVGRSVAVEMVQPFSMTLAGTIDFEATMDAGNKLILRLTAAGTLEGQKVVAGGAAQLFSIAYNPADHRFWQFRTTETTAIWEVSGDGSRFTKLAEEPLSALFVLDNVRVRLEIDNNDAMFGDQVIWDNVTADGPGTGGWCDVSTFREDFGASYTDRRWKATTKSSTATIKVADGQLVLTPNDGQNSDAFYRSSRLFDMTDQGVSVEVVEALAAPSTTALRLVNATEWVGFDITGDPDPMGDETMPVLAVRYRSEGATNTLATVPYVPAEHRWLRIRDDAGTLVWESSPDGMTWNIEGQQTPNPVTMDVMRIELIADATDTTPTPGQAIFDNVNVLP
ncbi:MAG TPA: hypothetical protein ENK57_04215 [Polyangiaceae bacterium]|nr:hypothetical protein [Polyangiaceae bacterium]